MVPDAEHRGPLLLLLLLENPSVPGVAPGAHNPENKAKYSKTRSPWLWSSAASVGSASGMMVSAREMVQSVTDEMATQARTVWCRKPHCTSKKSTRLLGLTVVGAGQREVGCWALTLSIQVADGAGEEQGVSASTSAAVVRRQEAG